MADDLTRQEIIFYTTFLRKPVGITQDEINDDMATLSGKIGWPEYFQNVPRCLEERIEIGEGLRNIIRIAPLTWQPNPLLSKYVAHLVDRHLSKEDKVKIGNLMQPSKSRQRRLVPN